MKIHISLSGSLPFSFISASIFMVKSVVFLFYDDGESEEREHETHVIASDMGSAIEVAQKQVDFLAEQEDEDVHSRWEIRSIERIGDELIFDEEIVKMIRATHA